jgi:hypothetical protein
MQVEAYLQHVWTENIEYWQQNWFIQFGRAALRKWLDESTNDGLDAMIWLEVPVSKDRVDK